MSLNKLESLKKISNVENNVFDIKIDNETEYRLNLIRIAIRNVFKE
ncbi:MAG: hypothetical protein GF329_20195 [Candidatus Lokiarchaeota archaeon]|nr:hypothetical protein [Candidatus Lokiarchaeota archaeon]